MQISLKNKFSIVIPLFNEEENVLPSIEKIFRVVGNNEQFLELILVDDGSQDSTVAKIEDFQQTEPRIKLVCHIKNIGLGGAIRSGLKKAAGDYVIYTDADLPFDFGLLPDLMAVAEDDCVISGFRMNRGEGLRRLILTKSYNFLVKSIFGLKLNDVNFACKIFPKKFLESANLSARGSFIDLEMLLEAARLQLKIKEYPLVYFPRERGLSTLSRPKVILVILQEMSRYFLDKFSWQDVLFSRNRKFVQKSFKLETSE